MACIYNERVKKSILPIFLGLLVLGLSFITFSSYGIKFGVDPSLKTELDLVLITLFLLAAYSGLAKSRHSFRYSIIADEMIIHRMCGSKNYVIEKVKLNKIKTICKVKKSQALMSGFKRTYSESLLKKDYLCAYETEQGSRTFYFSPSPSMISKLNTSIKAL